MPTRIPASSGAASPSLPSAPPRPSTRSSCALLPVHRLTVLFLCLTITLTVVVVVVTPRLSSRIDAADPVQSPATPSASPSPVVPSRSASTSPTPSSAPCSLECPQSTVPFTFGDERLNFFAPPLLADAAELLDAQQLSLLSLNGAGRNSLQALGSARSDPGAIITLGGSVTCGRFCDLERPPCSPPSAAACYAGQAEIFLHPQRLAPNITQLISPVHRGVDLPPPFVRCAWPAHLEHLLHQRSSTNDRVAQFLSLRVANLCVGATGVRKATSVLWQEIAQGGSDGQRCSIAGLPVALIVVDTALNDCEARPRFTEADALELAADHERLLFTVRALCPGNATPPVLWLVGGALHDSSARTLCSQQMAAVAAQHRQPVLYMDEFVRRFLHPLLLAQPLEDHRRFSWMAAGLHPSWIGQVSAHVRSA